MALASTAPTRETFVDPIHQAHDRLTEVLNRLDVLTDRLCGSGPKPDGNVTAMHPSNGLFDSLADHAAT